MNPWFGVNFWRNGENFISFFYGRKRKTGTGMEREGNREKIVLF